MLISGSPQWSYGVFKDDNYYFVMWNSEYYQFNLKNKEIKLIKRI